MKDGFHITLTSKHYENDFGEQENVCKTACVCTVTVVAINDCIYSSDFKWYILFQVHNLTEEELKRREVVIIDIVNDPFDSRVSFQDSETL